MSKLKRPAQVGNTIFGVGVDEAMVIDRAQRECEYQQTPAREAIRITQANEFFASIRKDFTIGKYTLRPGMETGRIWIEYDGGEGGDFDPAKLEAVIAEFYKANF